MRNNYLLIASLSSLGLLLLTSGAYAQVGGPDGVFSGTTFQDGYVPRNKKHCLSGVTEVGVKVTTDQDDEAALLAQLTESLAKLNIRTIKDGYRAELDGKPVLHFECKCDASTNEISQLLELTDMVILKRDPEIFGRAAIWSFRGKSGWVKGAKPSDATPEGLSIAMAFFGLDYQHVHKTKNESSKNEMSDSTATKKNRKK